MGPVSVSATGTPLINEWGAQGQVSYLQRGIASGCVDGTVLDVGTRMDDMIAEFPNWFTYGGMYKRVTIPDDPSKPRVTEPFSAFKNILGRRFRDFTPGQDNRFATFAINCIHGQQIIYDVDFSRHNPDNVKVIMMAVKNLFDLCPSALQDLAIQTPYSYQVMKINEALRNLVQILPGKPSVESLGIQVGTFDKMQGDEALYVITDFTNTENLGFLVQDKLVNTAITRARRLHCVITKMSIVPENWEPKGRMTRGANRITTNVPMHIAYHKYMEQRDTV